MAFGNNGFRSAFGNHRGEDIFWLFLYQSEVTLQSVFAVSQIYPVFYSYFCRSHSQTPMELIRLRQGCL